MKKTSSEGISQAESREGLKVPAIAPARDPASALRRLVAALAAQEGLFLIAVSLTGALPRGLPELHSVSSVSTFVLGSLSAISLLSLAGAGWLSLVNLLPYRALRLAFSFWLYLAVYLPVFNFGFFMFSRHLATAQVLRDAPTYFRHAPLGHVLGMVFALLVYLALVILSWRWRLFGEAWRDTAGGSARAAGIVRIAWLAGLSLLASSVTIATDAKCAPALSTSAHLVTGYLPDVSMAFVPRDSYQNELINRAAAVNTTGLLPATRVEAYLKGVRGKAAPERPNILIVMLESVTASHVGAYGYDRPTTPHFDQLAAQSLVFDRCFSVANESKHAQTSVHVSALPMRGRDDDFSNVDYRRLPWWIVFKTLGYQTAYISAQNEDWLHMKAFQLSGQFPPDVYLHALDMPEGPSYEGPLRKKDEATVNRRLFHYLDQAKIDGRPFVLMTNYQRTHYPFEIPNGWTPPFVPLANLGEFHAWTPTEIPSGINSFDSALSYVDEQLGSLIGYLDATGLAANTIVAVLSDHGIGFEPGVHPVSESLKDPYIHVPFLIRYPAKLSPGHFEENVSTIDLFPSLLGLLGAPSNPAWEGRDVLALGAAGCARRPVFSGSLIWVQRWLAVRGNLKVSMDLDSQTRAAFGRDDIMMENALPIGTDANALLRTLSTTLQHHVRFYENRDLHADFVYPGATYAGTSDETVVDSCMPGPEDLQPALRSLAMRSVWSFEKKGAGPLRTLRLHPDGRVESLGLPDHPAEFGWDIEGAQLRLLDKERNPTTRFTTISTSGGRVTFEGLHHDNPADVRLLRQVQMEPNGQTERAP